jgi:transcriptional regulator with XRE-family HTH domain
MGDTGKPIGRRIKECREAAGMTQQELAVRAGISLSNLAQIEQGQKADPRLSTLVAVADVLGVSLDVLADRSRRHTTGDIHPRKKP